MANYKKIFWVSSYPRSGNTWLRLILCGLFFTKDGNLVNLDILQNIPKLDSLNNFEFIKEISVNDYNLIFENILFEKKLNINPIKINNRNILNGFKIIHNIFDRQNDIYQLYITNF